jgi:hypothetical protein
VVDLSHCSRASRSKLQRLARFRSHGGQRWSNRNANEGSDGSSIPIALLRELAVVMLGIHKFMGYLLTGPMWSLLHAGNPPGIRRNSRQHHCRHKKTKAAARRDLEGGGDRPTPSPEWQAPFSLCRSSPSAVRPPKSPTLSARKDLSIKPMITLASTVGFDFST